MQEETPGESAVAIKRSAKRVILEYCVAVIVICAQVAGTANSSVVQNDYRYNKPYFLIYFGTNCMLFCLVLQFCYVSCFEYKKFWEAEFWVLLKNTMLDSTGLSPRRLAISTIPFAFFWFAANYLFVSVFFLAVSDHSKTQLTQEAIQTASLVMTNIASALTLEQSTTVFVYIMSSILLGETVTLGKVTAVLICCAGAILVPLADQFGKSESSSSTEDKYGVWSSLIGDCFVLGSALCAASFMVLYKLLLKDLKDAIPALNTFLFSIGAWNLILFWPGLIILDLTGVETFEIPPLWTVFGLVILGFFLGFVFNYFLNWGVILTNPLFMRIVVVCAIPVTFVVNALFFKGGFNILRIIGAALIIAGFVMFSTIKYYEELHHTTPFVPKPILTEEVVCQSIQTTETNDKTHVTVDL